MRFALEVAAVGAVAFWGWTAGEGAVGWILALAAPLAVIVVWALFVSPKAAIELARPLRLVIELGVVGAAAAAIAAAGHGTLALVFAVVAVVSGTLNYVWD